MKDRTLSVAGCVVRVALAASFLSAVADRFGLWGPPGSEGIAWGSVGQYEAYVAKLNWFLPASLISPLGWVATVAEVVIAVGLLIGRQLRWFALAAGLLLATFAVTMMTALGPKAPLDYSVPSAAGAAFLLAAVPVGRRCVHEIFEAVTTAKPWEVRDEDRRRRWHRTHREETDPASP